MALLTIPASYYEQFGADYSLPVPGEGYGGWKKADLAIDPSKTALVVMHAWDVGTRETNPGTFDACEYVTRSYEICETVLPPILSAVRSSPLKLYHVVGGGDYYKEYEGYQEARRLAGETPWQPHAKADDTLRALHQFRAENVFPGRKNLGRMTYPYTFAPQALPKEGENIAENAEQLFALCERDSINHLIYTGFAINMCLLISPGGMVDMSRRGIMCSAIKEAVTAGENKESARTETAKELALWYLSVMFGFVYEAGDFIRAIQPETV